MSQSFLKDPDSILDYKWDWSDWLEAAETISTQTCVADSNDLSVDSSSITDSSKSVTAWLSGGVAGMRYTVTNHIVTSAAREDDRSITVSVEER